MTKYNFHELEEVTVIGEGESYLVKECIHKGVAVAVKHIKTQASGIDKGKFYRRLATVLPDLRIMEHPPLKHHSNIIELLGFGWTALGENLLPYMVVEHGIHGSLRSYMAGHQNLPLLSKIIFSGDVAAGLMALHACQIVHGDLKLDNVIVFDSWDRPSGTIAKLCDFGHSILTFAEEGRVFKYYGTHL